MNIKEAVDSLNFWIRKQRGSFYTIEECTEAIDRAQIAYYLDIKPKYATSQVVKDILSPFKYRFDFTPSDVVSGRIVFPFRTNFLDLLDVQIQFQISNTTLYAPVKMINEDERAERLNSQIDPVTATNPIGEVMQPDTLGNPTIQLYPAGTYTGTITMLRRPRKPVYAYTVISGRVIVYDSVNSVQLEWRETEINTILLKALSYLGINLSDQEVLAYSQLRNQENYQGFNHL